MKSYSLSRLADQTLLSDLAVLVARDRATTASLLAHLAEVDARKLYLPAGYPSMFVYCVEELHLSEDSACKRIRAARTAREYPGVLPAMAEGRLHLSAVVLLAPYLTPANAAELLAEAVYRSRGEIEGFLAERFPRSEVLPLVEVVGWMQTPAAEISPGTRQEPGVALGAAPPAPAVSGHQLAPGLVEPPAPGRMNPPSRTAPIGPRRFVLQLTMSQDLHDKLENARQLLSHRVPSGHLAEVLEHVLDLAIPQLEKRKFAATGKPRSSRRSSSGAGMSRRT